MSRWISVEDRLPKESGYYLIVHNTMMGKIIISGAIDRCFYEPDPNFGWEEVNVTHWMPLPAPPKENNSE